jgi:hypothetical protein
MAGNPFSSARLHKMLQVIVDVADGDLTCTPAVLHAHAGDAIGFHANGKPFAIQSKGVSPLTAAEIRSPGAVANLNVRPDATSGAYSFACAVYADGQIYIDASCPSIIID